MKTGKCRESVEREPLHTVKFFAYERWAVKRLFLGLKSFLTKRGAAISPLDFKLCTKTAKKTVLPLILRLIIPNHPPPHPPPPSHPPHLNINSMV